VSERVVAATRLLCRRGWTLGLIGVLAFSAGCLALGQWQFDRHQNKALRNQRIDANYASQPLTLSQVLSDPSSPLLPDRIWQPVRVAGEYLAADTVVVRNRPLRGVFGYEVLVPLVLPDGTALLVDRGWIPNGENGSAPDSVPPVPSGTVTVVVRLRTGEPNLDRAPIPGQASSIDLTELAQRFRLRLFGAYGVLAEEQPTAPQTPASLPRPDEDLGPHLAYAVQWWAFALAGPVLFARALDREATQSPTVAGPVRRHRPTDEDYEDALTGG
jgi:cytochrome oxidase assembly protein ShyY1